MHTTHPTRLPPSAPFTERHRVIGTLLVLVFLVLLGASTGGFIGSLLAQALDGLLDLSVFTPDVARP